MTLACVMRDLSQSNGSARVTIAHNGTDVLAAVKVGNLSLQCHNRSIFAVECGVNRMVQRVDRALVTLLVQKL